MTTYWVSMTLCDTQMRQRQNQVIAWDGAGSKTKGAKKNGKLSYWGEGRRRPAGRSLEKCLLCHRSTINYSNLQMAFNVGWNRKGLSFVRVFAVIGPTRFPIPCTQQVGARGGGGGGGGEEVSKDGSKDGSLPMTEVVVATLAKFRLFW